MRRDEVDVVIVGARVAGAALACFLRRHDVSTLLIERKALPSDQVLSTHTIHPEGMHILDDLGLGDAVRLEAPAMRSMIWSKEHADLVLPLAPDQFEYCPRRKRLDALLQGAAQAAGAELRDRTRVMDLLHENGRVVGVRALSPEGSAYEIRARLVVGADGPNSTVAARAGAVETHAYEGPRMMYWAYFPAPEGYEPTMRIAYRGDRIRMAFATDDDQILLGCVLDRSEGHDFSHAPLSSLLAALREDERFEPWTHTRPSEPVRGIRNPRYFMRQATGPGWALVGDAGVTKEFVTGFGITDALRQARDLAEAVAIGSENALEAFWHARDVQSLPWFFFSQDHGTSGSRSAFEVLALAEMAKDPALIGRMVETIEGTRSPYDVVPLQRALAWLGAGLGRGRLNLLPGFLSTGARMQHVQRLVTQARERLKSVQRRSSAPWPRYARQASGSDRPESGKDALA